MTDKADREAFDPAEIEKLIAYMVNQFLNWRLPSNFSPDAGITFKPNYNEHTPHPAMHEPYGTNLFDAVQAQAMVRYMLAGSALCTGYQAAHDAAMAAEPDVAAFCARLESIRDSRDRISQHALSTVIDFLRTQALQLQAAQQREAELRNALTEVRERLDAWATHRTIDPHFSVDCAREIVDAALATQPASKGETT